MSESSKKSSSKKLVLPRKKPVTQHAKSGIIFSVARVRRNLRAGRYAKHIQVGGSVYLASVLEYLVAEVTELAGNAARDNNRRNITPRHINLAVRQDVELEQLLHDVTFAQGGVIPFIHTVLLPKRSTNVSSQEV